MAAAPQVPAGPGDVVYGLGRIDSSGRVAGREVTGALGWRTGDRLTVTASGGAIVARRDPGGMVVLPSGARVAIPAVLRRRCGLRAGDRVLLAAVPDLDALAAFPMAVVDQAIRVRGLLAPAAGGRP